MLFPLPSLPSSWRRRFVPALILATVSLLSGVASARANFALKSGDRVVLIGDTFIEREQQEGWIETMLTVRFADRDVTFRNLGWSADTPAGASREGLSLVQAGREPADEGWNLLVSQVREAQPTVVFVGYGMADSFAGVAGLPAFRAQYIRLLDTLKGMAPAVRLVLLSPIAHERLGPPWPDPAGHNADLARYAQAIGEIARERGLPFVSLYERMLAAAPAPGQALTDNGIHLSGRGYRQVAGWIEQDLLGGPAAGADWRTNPAVEPLREAIRRKNEWFFHRSRPANMAYIFGFRKREQGRNASEVLRFDTFIAEEEKRIAALRGLSGGPVPPVPPPPERLGGGMTPLPRPDFEVADGFDVTLWAENPLLHKPIQMNFDARGRLWVASSEVYPQVEPGQPATDKIIVLEDTTGEGRADRATVFADGLLIPTGIELTADGCYVAQSTELLRFRDTDGDGRADRREIVLSGFGTEDTHHNLHTLRWGPDGRLYMNQAVYTRTQTETPHGVVRLEAGGMFRLDPRNLRLEIPYYGWINTWGHQFDRYGQSFMTDGAGFQGLTWGILGATYRTHGPGRRMIDSITPGRFPKFCGLEIVRSAHFPADWQGDFVTADFRAHRVVRFKVSEDGSGFSGREMPDLLRTTSDSFRPIDLKLGPDGALYIADWSNPIIQHGEVDFRDPRRDKIHGRIWRIAAKGRAPLPRRDFARLSEGELLDSLLSQNSYDQERARRVLFERGADQVLPALRLWLDRHADESAKLQALWIFQGFDAIPPGFAEALAEAADPGVRAAAIRTLPGPEALALAERKLADPHPRVRLEAVRALGRTGAPRAAALALALVEQPMDPFFEYAVWLTINDLAQPWLAAVRSGEWAIAGRERQLEYGLRAVPAAQASEVLAQLVSRESLPRDGSGPWLDLIGAAGGPAELRLVFERVRENVFTPAAKVRGLNALAEAARLRDARPTGDLSAVAALLTHGDAAVRAAAAAVSGAWRLKPVVPRLVELSASENASEAERRASLSALREIGGADAIAGLQRIVRTTPRPEVRRDALVALAGLELPTALPDVIRVLQSATDEAEAEALWRALLPVRSLGARLAVELAKAGLPAAAARAGLRPAREGTQHQELAGALAKLAGVAIAIAALTHDEMKNLAREALAQGDAARGEWIYRRPELACVACHAIGGVGGKLGPDLTSIGASAPADYLVESLVAPNAKIKEGYHSVLLRTSDGRELSGMIVRESASEIVLRDAANQETSVPVRAVQGRTSVGSMMPAGLIDGLPRDEVLDLLKFLAQLGKPGEFDAAQSGVARMWRSYLVVSANQHLGVDRVVKGDFSLESWLPVMALTSGTLTKPLLAKSITQTVNSRGFYLATRFNARAEGPVRFTLRGADAVMHAWLNGRSIRVGETFEAEAGRGENVLVLQLDEQAPPAELRLRAVDVAFGLD